MRTIIVIPARMASTRLPGKPLIDLCGKSMIHRTWERCAQVVASDDIYVATDDAEIERHCGDRGIQTVMTSPSCLTGTDRVHEAAEKIAADVIINVQGDEPIVNPDDIRKMIDASQQYPGELLNGMCPIDTEEDFRSPTIPKVVTRPDGRLLYMSRAPIPSNKSHGFVRAMKQVCIYALNLQILRDFTSVQQKTPLEEIEDLEMLRVLELGYDMRMIELSTTSIAVDTPEDAEKVRRIIREQGGE